MSTFGSGEGHPSQSNGVAPAPSWGPVSTHPGQATGEIKRVLSFNLASGTSPAEYRVSDDQNEDSLFTSQDGAAIGVFDGVGGNAGSAEASKIAAELMRDALGNRDQLYMPRHFSRILLQEAMLDAHYAIDSVATSSDSTIATTGTAAKLFRDEAGQPYVTIGNVGDSRAYLFRGGFLRFLTLDNDYGVTGEELQDRTEQQVRLASVTDFNTLSEEDQRAFNERSVIYEALGAEHAPNVSLTQIDLKHGDTILLTTDGIHDNLTTDEISAITENVPLDVMPNYLIRMARIRSRNAHVRSKYDDMTAAAINFIG